MEDKVYPSQQSAAYHNSFVWAKLDVDKSESKRLLSQFGGRGVPFVAYLSKYGEVVDTSLGKLSTEQFVGKLAKVSQANQPATPVARTTTAKPAVTAPTNTTTSSEEKKKRVFKPFKKRPSR